MKVQMDVNLEETRETNPNQGTSVGLFTFLFTYTTHSVKLIARVFMSPQLI